MTPVARHALESELPDDAAQVVTVTMKGIAFEPVEIEVERGALVRLAF